MKRLFSCRVLFASLFLLSSGQLSLAQSANDEAVPQVEQAPMDEDWHNEVSTKALLGELTRMATQLEEQRKENASLAAKVDRLTKRLDGMQTQLANAGYGATAPKMLPEDLDSGSGAISLSDDPAPDASKTDAASPKALPLADAPTNADGAPIGKQEAAKEGAVERAPLTPLDAPEGSGTARRSPEEGGYFSRLVRKSEKMIGQITDW